MRKVLVIGSGGSGKSTFANELAAVTGIEVIHLDREYWRPNWEKTPSEEWEARVSAMLKAESWIIDGNFGGTRETRIRAADTVIFLDLSRYICLYRILKRTIKFHGQSRPDMAAGCDERFDLEFLIWIWNYPKRSRKRVLDELKKRPEKDIRIFRTRQEISQFLSKLKV
jgi:adenylate kinase family enzyme